MPSIQNKIIMDRPLLPAEQAEAEKVFGKSIDYSRVRIISAPYTRLQKSTDICTPNGKIYWPKADTKVNLVSTLSDAHKFIHEMVHARQYQMGEEMKLSVCLGILAHVVTATAFNPYKYRVGKNWKDYSCEQQAELVADAYCEGFSVFKNEFFEPLDSVMVHGPHSFNKVNLETPFNEWVYNIV